MYIRSELAPAMAVANKIAYNREDDAEGLERDVPAGTNDLGRLEPE